VERLTAEVTLLWVTDRSRTTRPTVTDEVRTGLFYFDNTLVGRAARHLRDMADALAQYYPALRPPDNFLTFASWIGGDRDGNPNVTTDVTASRPCAFTAAWPWRSTASTPVASIAR
jgi:phosphoenolpyruvate carboxylase